MSQERGSAAPKPRYIRGDRVAWAEGPDRPAGEGVITELLPPTHADKQDRYRIETFVNGVASGRAFILPHGVLYAVRKWEHDLPREERLDVHHGRTLPWNEPITGE